MEKRNSFVYTKMGNGYVVLKTEPPETIKSGDKILHLNTMDGSQIAVKPSPIKPGDRILIFGKYAIGIDKDPNALARALSSPKKIEVLR